MADKPKEKPKPAPTEPEMKPRKPQRGKTDGK